MEEMFEMSDFGYAPFFGHETLLSDERYFSFTMQICLGCFFLNFMFPTSFLSKYMTSPSEVHFGIAKCALRYSKGTVDYDIWFRKTGEINLYSYCDSD